MGAAESAGDVVALHELRRPAHPLVRPRDVVDQLARPEEQAEDRVHGGDLGQLAGADRRHCLVDQDEALLDPIGHEEHPAEAHQRLELDVGIAEPAPDRDRVAQQDLPRSRVRLREGLQDQRPAVLGAVLADVGEDGPEHGWALILQAFAEPDAAAREALLRDAIAIGRRFGDPDVEFEALVCLGGVFLVTGRVEEGLVLIDEAMAAVCAGELTEIATVDSIFCLFFWACELVNDVPRADQWMRRAAELMQRRNVAGAFCRAHYGGILTAAGRWDEAEAQLVESTRHVRPRHAARPRR